MTSSLAPSGCGSSAAAVVPSHPAAVRLGGDDQRPGALVVLLLAAIGVALVLSTRNANAPAPGVPATPTGHTPAQHAQNLARWIHDHTA
jgi:hypothetical protein